MGSFNMFFLQAFTEWLKDRKKELKEGMEELKQEVKEVWHTAQHTTHTPHFIAVTNFFSKVMHFLGYCAHIAVPSVPSGILPESDCCVWQWHLYYKMETQPTKLKHSILVPGENFIAILLKNMFCCRACPSPPGPSEIALGLVDSASGAYLPLTVQPGSEIRRDERSASEDERGFSKGPGEGVTSVSHKPSLPQSHCTTALQVVFPVVLRRSQQHQKQQLQ